MRIKIPVLSFILIAITLVMAFAVLHLTSPKIGSPFPGYLAFKNGMVGAFYVPGWEGERQGLHYHSIVEKTEGGVSTFSQKDYLLVVVFPVVSGLLFVIIGSLASLALPVPSARLACLAFHFLAGIYVLLSPEFHLTYRFAYLHLAVFAFIPATMIHFAHLFPAGFMKQEKRWWWGYAISLLILIPYAHFFERSLKAWTIVEYAVVLYVVATYLFWIGRLFAALKRPQFEAEKLIARYLLSGQLIAFIVPLMATVLVFVFQVSFPLNLATPLTLCFPVALLVGNVLGRLKQGQVLLVRSEKKAAMGQLMAGLAHELKNPLTFVYSNLEPFQEALGELKSLLPANEESQRVMDELKGIAANMEEGSTRSLALIDTFRNFSHPGNPRAEKVTIGVVLDHALKLLKGRWEHRIHIECRDSVQARVTGHPLELEQVFVNILSNACDAIPGQGKISIEARRGRKKVFIHITDSGCGLDEEELARIFDPFYTTKAQGKGMGLGLAITREILERSQGTIDVRSKKGLGTEVIVSLPEA